MTRCCVLHCELDSEALSSWSGQLKDVRDERRIIALRLIASGQTALEVAKVIALNERTVRVWVAKFNDGGIESLGYAKPPGGKKRLTSEQEAE